MSKDYITEEQWNDHIHISKGTIRMIGKGILCIIIAISIVCAFLKTIDYFNHVSDLEMKNSQYERASNQMTTFVNAYMMPSMEACEHSNETNCFEKELVKIAKTS